MSVTMPRPRVLRFVVPSSPPYPPRRVRWVRYAVRAVLCLIAIAAGLAIGGY